MRVSQYAPALARIGLGAVAACVLSAPVWAEEEAQPAVWAPKELHFVYMGFTTHYSCEGLRDQVRDILLELGARKEDLKVRESGCASRLGAPDPFPGVDIRMKVLQPAAGVTSEPPVNAHWKNVDLLKRRSPLDAAGQCELFEQVKQRILPLFTVRNLDFASSCVPHQLSVGGQRLTAQVLVADQPRTAAP